MAKTMTKQHKQLLAGGLTLALATALLVATALWVHNASQEVIPTRPTAPPTEPPPTLAPNPYGAADFEEEKLFSAPTPHAFRALFGQ